MFASYSSRLMRSSPLGGRAAVGAVRCLNVHEYISMEIMSSHGIKTPECHVASNAEEAENLFLHSFNKGRV
jgi:hypothetical protein